MLFTRIPLQSCLHVTVKFSPCPSGFGCIIYCLARENGRVIKSPQPHAFMDKIGGFASKLAHTYA